MPRAHDPNPSASKDCVTSRFSTNSSCGKGPWWVKPFLFEHPTLAFKQVASPALTPSHLVTSASNTIQLTLLEDRPTCYPLHQQTPSSASWRRAPNRSSQRPGGLMSEALGGWFEGMLWRFARRCFDASDMKMSCYRQSSEKLNASDSSSSSWNLVHCVCVVILCVSKPGFLVNQKTFETNYGGWQWSYYLKFRPTTK